MRRVCCFLMKAGVCLDLRGGSGEWLLEPAWVTGVDFAPALDGRVVLLAALFFLWADLGVAFRAAFWVVLLAVDFFAADFFDALFLDVAMSVMG